MSNQDKFGLISFLAIIMVVMIHSNLGGVGEFIVPAVTHWAVPWFFFCSGVFLKQSCDRYSAKELMIKKFHSLVIPLLLWMVIWSPLGGAANLWYLKSLICFTFSVIALRVLTRKFGLGIWLLLIGIVFSVLTVADVSWYIGTTTSPFYFLLGIFFSDRILRGVWKPCRGGMFVLYVLGAISVKAIWFLVPLQRGAEMVVRNAGVVATIIAMWFGLDMLPRGFRLEAPVFKTVFFVYCFHGPIVRSAKQYWMYYIGGHQDVGFFLIVLFAVSCSTGVALCLRRFAPLTYKVISGGR